MSPAARPPRVLTVGHSTRGLDELLALLAAHGVDLLVDVRRHPGSQRMPWFGRDALSAALSGAGIGYRHEPDLGGRRRPRPDSPNTGWRNHSFRGYADHLATPAFRGALERLVADAAAGTPVILCAEAVPWRCHRQLIADALVVRGIEVLHVLDRARADRHVLRAEAAVTPDGTVIYPAQPG